MDGVIIRGTTPTMTLTIEEEVPEGSISTVTVTQGNSSFNPDVEYDPVTNSVTFTFSKLHTETFVSGESVFIQQSMTFPDGQIETFPEHELEVEDMIYAEPEEPEDPYVETEPYLTDDTEIVSEIVYFEYVYVKVPPMTESSPLDMGLYELVNDDYTLSQDKEFLDKDYYLQQLAPVTPNGDENPSEEGWLVIDDDTEPDEDDVYDDDDEAKYTIVEPIGTEDPSEEGWLVIDESGYYVQSIDRTVQPDVEYYESIEEDYLDDTDIFYDDFDEDAYASYNGLTCVDDEDPEEYSDYVYSPVVDVTGSENPSSLEWYEKTGGDYVLSQDTVASQSKQYYKLIENSEWVVDDDSTGGLIPEED